jgi:serine/threonine-protein kinase
VAAIREDGERAATSVAAARGTRPELLARRLRGDLDNVVATALAKEPDRRYPSVAQLAEDVGRHLAGHPVTARPQTVGYRLAKFIRRHRLGAGAAAVALAALVAAAAALAVQSRRVARERDRANQVARLLVDLFHVAEPGAGRGGTITARELLDRGAAQVEAMEGQPGTQAMLLGQLADLYEPLGLYDRAAELLREAVRIDRELHREPRVELAARLNQWGRVLAAKGDFRGAEPLFGEALDLYQRLLGAESREASALLNNLALVRHDQGDYEGAAPLYRRTLEIERRLRGNAHPTSLGNYALLLSDLGDYAEAERIVRELLARARGGGEDDELADHLEHLGQIRQARGDFVEAEALLGEALALRRRLFGDDHRDVARSLHALGALALERGDVAAAEAPLAAALERRRRLLGAGHPEYVESLRESAALAAARGRREEAAARYRRAIDIDAAALGVDHPLTGLARAGLGEVLAAAGDCAAAEPELREALRLLPARDWRRPAAAAALAGCLAARGDPVAARPLLVESHRAVAARLGEDDPAAVRLRERLARLGG